MSFRPNPSALVKPSGQADDDDDDDGQPRASTSSAASAGALYRPPRLAAVPYSDLPKSGRRGAKGKEPASGSNGKTSSLLKDYALGTISSLPHQETTSGLPSLSSSARATAHKRSLAQEQDAYEEASFVRLPLKKSELKRREREERDDAFGIGGGSITGWDDVLGGLSSVGGYGAERGGGERASAWERRKRTGDEGAARAAKPAKKGRFERDVGKQARRGGKK
jgi:U3 small nucleolar ribonucleoprotein protein LCP5